MGLHYADVDHWQRRVEALERENERLRRVADVARKVVEGDPALSGYFADEGHVFLRDVLAALDIPAEQLAEALGLEAGAMRCVWVVEMYTDEEGWQPTVGVALDRPDGCARIKEWGKKNPDDTFRLTPYIPAPRKAKR